MKKKIWPTIVGVLAVLYLIGSIGGKDEKKTTPTVSTEPTKIVVTSSSETTSPSTTISKENTEAPTEPTTTEANSTSAETEAPTIYTTEMSTEPDPTTEVRPAMTEDSTFEIYFLDVGQGDAACVLCDGQAMLIDGGPSSESDLIYSFLKAHGLSHLDYIIATHPDGDHVGGLAGALNYATVGTAYCTVEQHDSESFQDFIKYLGKQDAHITIPNSGDTFYLGCSQATILYPGAGETITDNTSIALRIEYGDTSFLFTGDCESEDEAAIINSTYALSSDVIKIAHHGSKHSTTSLFLGNVNPKYAVISVGGTNNYGHPTEDVLSKLKRRNIELYRTDIHGDIHCISDGKTITFDVQKNADVDPYITSGGYKNYLDEQAAKETEPPTERTTPVNTEPAPTEPRVTYIVNTNTGKFHYPSCSSVGQMKESNKWYYTGDRDDLIDLGYQPCGRCHP